MNLLTSNDIKYFSGVFRDHFDSFSAFNTLVVYKEPIKVVSSVNTNSYPGYATASNRDSITYLPVSGTFNAIVTHDDVQTQGQVGPLNLALDQGKVRIKVDQAARDYIENGRTESISLNGDTFNVITADRVQNYLGKRYYVYHLERAK